MLSYYTALDCTAQTCTELQDSVINCLLLHRPELHFVHYTELLWHAMNMQLTAGFWYTLHPTELTSTAFLWTALHCAALHWTAPRCTALHCTAQHCTALHCIVLHSTALHYTSLHCTSLHFTALNFTALHYTATNKKCKKLSKRGFIVLVQLSAHVERVSVSRMRHFSFSSSLPHTWRKNSA